MKGFQLGHAQSNSGRTHFKKGQVSLMKGKKHTPESIEKMKESLRGRKAPKTAFKKGNVPYNYKGGKPKCFKCGKLLTSYKAKACRQHFGELLRQENHHNWKGGISRDVHSLQTPAYRKWRLGVFSRDGFKCRMANDDCCGQLQAHHILRWSEFPELRYDINNGIALCQFHHPRKRDEEKRLIPTFRELVSVSNEQY